MSSLICGCGTGGIPMSAIGAHFQTAHARSIAALVPTLRGQSAWITVGTPESGQWCKDCLLPSRAVFPLYVLSDDGPIRIGEATACLACDGVSEN